MENVLPTNGPPGSTGSPFSRSERCADLRGRTSLTSGTARVGREVEERVLGGGCLDLIDGVEAAEIPVS